MVSTSENEVFATFGIEVEAAPRILFHSWDSQTSFDGPFSVETISKFLEKSIASAEGEEIDNDWQVVDVEDDDIDSTLRRYRSLFTYDGSSGMQILAKKPSFLRLPPTIRWSKRDWESLRPIPDSLSSILLNLRLLSWQNETSVFNTVELDEGIKNLFARAAAILSETAHISDVDLDMNLDGQLCYPREDGAYEESFLQWNYSRLAELRSAAMSLGQKSVADEFDGPMVAIRASLAELPIPAFVRNLMEHEGKCSSLKPATFSRLRDLIQGYVSLKVLIRDNQDPIFLESTSRLATLVQNAFAVSEYQFELALGVRDFELAGREIARKLSTEGVFEHDKIGDLPTFRRPLSAEQQQDEYNLAVLNVLVVSKVSQMANPNKDAQLCASLAELDHVLKQYCMECAPRGVYQIPSPCAPLVDR
jgi:hypothetical protein